MTSNGYDFAERSGDSPTSPVIFLFHGTGGDEHQFLELAAQLMPGARRVAPRGDVSEGGAARYFRRLAEGRYDMADLARATARMRGFVEAGIGATRPSQVAGFGYSNGANILAAVQMEDAALFDSTVLLHPLIPFQPAPQPALAGKRVLITAGRNDPICPAPSTEALAGWYREQGAELELFWHDGGHEIRQEELAAARDFLNR